MALSQAQIAAWEAGGMHLHGSGSIAHLIFYILGAVTLLVAVALLSQIMHLLNTQSEGDRAWFYMHLWGIIFIVSFILLIMAMSNS